MKPESHKKRSLLESIGYKLFPNLMLHRKAEDLPLEINWRRIFILPTKPGLFFGLVTFIMLVASLNFNNNLGLMMTFLLFGLAQVSLYRVFFNLRNIIIDHVTAHPVFLGKNAVFHVYMKSEISRFDICLKNDLNSNCLLELPASKAKLLVCQLQTRQRGYIECGKIKVMTSYPFGLFYAWIWTYLDAKCLVYPTPETSPPALPLHAQSEGKNAILINGENFHGLKPYHAGDSLKLIAWKRTAQTGELISREFEQNQGEKLLLDFSQISLPDVELKLARLTAWILMAQQQQVEFCLKLPNFNSGYGYSNKHHLDCLKKLALYGLEN